MNLVPQYFNKLAYLLIIALVTGLTLALGLIQITRAATLTVTKTADTNDGVCDSDCSLREAIIAANTMTGTDTIILPAGVYTLTRPGDSEELGATGDLDVTDSLIITGAGAVSTIIDGGRLDRVLDIHSTADSTFPVEISGVTIQGGQTPLGPGGDFRFSAGGILNGATLTLKDSVVKNNIGGVGGGILNAGTLVLTNTLVSDNLAEIGASGGGIMSSGPLILTNSVITNNQAYAGGGISSTGPLTLTHSIISANENGGLSATGSTTILHSTISGNRGDGGILFFGLFDTDAITIYNSTISGNSGNTFGNLPNRGGGITHRRGLMRIANSTISGNSANNSGGGISIETGTIILNNVTITGNTADSDSDGTGDGGGLFRSTAGVEVNNSIIAGNFDQSSSGNVHPDCSASLNFAGYSLIQNLAGCLFLSPSTGVITNTDPGLGPLQDNGGATLTHALLADSPAIDTGNPDTPGSTNACEATDQRDVPRPQQVRCDIGAYERQSYRILLPLLLR